MHLNKVCVDDSYQNSLIRVSNMHACTEWLQQCLNLKIIFKHCEESNVANFLRRLGALRELKLSWERVDGDLVVSEAGTLRNVFEGMLPLPGLKHFDIVQLRGF